MFSDRSGFSTAELCALQCWSLKLFDCRHCPQEYDYPSNLPGVPFLLLYIIITVRIAITTIMVSIVTVRITPWCAGGRHYDKSDHSEDTRCWCDSRILLTFRCFQFCLMCLSGTLGGTPPGFETGKGPLCLMGPGTSA